MQNRTVKPKLTFYDRKPIIGTIPNNFGVVGTLIGLFMRVFVIFMAVFSLSSLFCKSFELDIKFSTIFFVAGLSVFIFALMSYFKPLLLSFSIIGFLSVLIIVLKTENIGLKYFSAIRMTSNKMIDRLIDVGFYGLLEDKAEVPLPTNNGIENIIIIMILVLSAIFTFSCVRRTRILLPSIASVFILTPLFLYNVVEGNAYITIFICSATAIIIMQAFDKIYVRNSSNAEYDSALNIMEETDITSKDKTIPSLNVKEHIPQASCGIAGFCAFILALVILIIPSVKTKKEFPTINFIDNKIEMSRQFITAYLLGNPDLLDELLYAMKYLNFKPRDLNLRDLNFTGEKILKVESQTNIPIYLRSWVATDYKKGAWLTADYGGEDYNNFNSLFGKNSDPSSIMFADFFDFINNDALLESLDYENKGVYNKELGFIMMQVNIQKLSSKVNDIIYLPTYTNPLYPIRKYGSPNTTNLSYANFFDGVYSGKGFDKGAKYGVVAFVPSYEDFSQLENMSPYIVVYANIIDYVTPELERYIERCFELQKSGQYNEDGYFKDDAKLSSIKDEIYNKLYTYKIKIVEEPPIYIQYRDIVAKDKQRAFVDSICNSYLYSDFVYKTYTKTANSAIITDYYRNIVETAQNKSFAYADQKFSTEPTSYLNRHLLVTEIIGTITEKDVFEYVFFPTKKPNSSLDPIENFLTVTHEGYCMQFASAAVLLLREAGIPARYVEGYVALDFAPNNADDAVGSYVATVRDEHAHAWIEVWYDGIGWVQYEATAIASLLSSIGDFEPPIVSETTRTPRTTVPPIIQTTPPTSTSTTAPDTTKIPDTSTDTSTDTNTSDISNTTTSAPPDTPVIPGTVTDTDIDTSKNDSTVTISPTESGKTKDPVEIARQRKIITIFIVTAFSIITLSGTSAFIVISNKKGVILQTERNELVRKIKSNAYDLNVQRNLALNIGENITSLLKIYGSQPLTGEFSTEYAYRLGETYPEIFRDNITAAEMLFHIASEEFGRSMSAEGILSLALVYTQLYNNRKTYLNIFERLYYRLFKHSI